MAHAQVQDLKVYPSHDENDPLNDGSRRPRRHKRMTMDKMVTQDREKHRGIGSHAGTRY